MTTKTIILDITEAKLPPLVTVKQGDSGRTLEVVVQDGGKDFAAPLGTTATLRIMDTQGRSASVPGTVVAFGGKTTVTVGLTSEALAYAGKYAADIKLSSPGGSESTLNFWLEVQIAPSSDTPIPTPGGGITAEEAGRIAENKIEANVPSWAREETKPTYTASDVGAIPATDYAVYNDTKAGTAKKALPVSLQHTAVLFGLSKAAGVDLAGRTDVGIGNYPADAKAAIAQMLGVPTESRFSESILEIREMIPATGGGGLSAAAANLLLEILGAAVYTQNVSGKINRLKDMLISGTPDSPDQPGEPDEPVPPEDEITVEYGVMTITAVYSDITVNDGVMTIQ